MTAQGSARVLREDRGVIAGEHSVFVVRGEDESPLAAPWDGNTLVTVDDDATRGWDLFVNTGDQWGPYDVTTRWLDAEPGPPEPRWEDVVEVSIRATGPLVVTEMIDNTPAIALLDTPGDYRLRVSARGRGAARDDDALDRAEHRGADDDGPPIEWYLLEVWAAPAADPEVLRLDSPRAHELLNPAPPLVIPEGEAGLATARRIGRDVDGKPGARTLSGELGSVSTERTIRGTRRKLFFGFAHLNSWSHCWVPGPSWSYSDEGSEDYQIGSSQWSWSHDHPDQLTGEHGAVRTSLVEVARPHRAVRRWDWMIDPGPQQVPFWEQVPLLASPSIITVTLTQHRDEARDPWTTIRIDHEHLPVEWLEDMETYWDYQLSIAEHAEFGIT